MKFRKRIISLKSICIIVLICSACSPKPITRGEPDAYGCIPPPASTFASVGGDISIAQSTIGKVVTGDIKIKTQPEVINLLSKSVVDQELRSYLRCLAINQNKYTQEQAAYLESMSLFSATNPTPEQFQKWQDSHPFPINTSDAELERIVSKVAKEFEKTLSEKYSDGHIVFGLKQDGFVVPKGIVPAGFDISWNTGKVINMSENVIKVTIPSMTINTDRIKNVRILRNTITMSKQITGRAVSFIKMSNVSIQIEVLGVDKDLVTVGLGFVLDSSK